MKSLLNLAKSLGATSPATAAAAPKASSPATHLVAKDLAAFRAVNSCAKGKLGRQASVWSYASVDDSAVVGDRAAVMEHAVVASGVLIGADSVIGPRARIGSGAVIGKNVLVGAGAVIANKAVVPDGSYVAPGAVFPSSNVTPIADSGSMRICKLAQQAHKDWSMTLEETENARIIADNPEHAPGHWKAYVASNPNPIRHPERKGLVFDR